MSWKLQRKSSYIELLCQCKKFWLLINTVSNEWEELEVLSTQLSSFLIIHIVVVSWKKSEEEETQVVFVQQICPLTCLNES